MKLKTTLEIDIEVRNNEIITDSKKVAELIIGSSAISGNYKLYGITKTKNKFYISKEYLRKRKEKLKNRIEKMKDSIKIIESVLKGDTNEKK